MGNFCSTLAFDLSLGLFICFIYAFFPKQRGCKGPVYCLRPSIVALAPDSVARGPVDPSTRRLVDPWTRRPVDPWTRRPMNLTMIHHDSPYFTIIHHY